MEKKSVSLQYPGTLQRWMKQRVEEINKTPPDQRDDSAQWFEDLGIPKRFWRDPIRFFGDVALVFGCTDQEDFEMREGFKRLIELRWKPKHVNPDDREAYFWSTLMFSFGISVLWYQKHNAQTERSHALKEKMSKELQKTRKTASKAYERILKTQSQERLTNKAHF